MSTSAVDDLLRSLAPQVIGILVGRFGRFDAVEDAVQEALLAASVQWTEIPDHPRSWLVTVASRRLVDEFRSEAARERRERDAIALEPDDAGASTIDDSLTLVFLCCHPSLTLPSQIALTLRAVGGLTTAQIARAFLVPEATMGQRISRAKQQIRASGLPFELPGDDRAERLDAVLRVLYLIFNEGYTPGSRGIDVDLGTEAIRLARLLRSLVPDADEGAGEVAGLLALMLLTDARRAARQDADGLLVPLAEQDRSRWNRTQLEEGVALVTATLGSGPLGSYQLQAAIAAVHGEAATAADTDWPQILALYSVLERVEPGPVVILNKAVATAMVHGPLAGLALLGTLDGNDRMAQTHRLDAVRGHLLELAGDPAAARVSYERAIRGGASVDEQRYLALRAASLPRS